MSQSQKLQCISHPRVKFVGGPKPRLGYGFLINEDNRQHFARFAQQVLGLSDLSPDEEKEFLPAFAASADILSPTYLFHGRPAMVPVRNHLALAYDEHGGLADLFILCGDGCPATESVPIFDEDLDYVREVLGIPPTTQPQWYKVIKAAWSNFAV